MTVKCFTVKEKDTVVSQYNNKVFDTLKQQANYWGTSTRTIGRILEERGIATPVPRLKGEAHAVMLVLKDHGIYTAKELATRLIGPTTPPKASNVVPFFHKNVPALLDVHFPAAVAHHPA